MTHAFNQMIRLAFLATVTAVLAVLFAAPVLGGPYVKILSTDTSAFPTVLLKVAVSNGGRGAPSDITDEGLLVYEDGFRVNTVSVKRVESEEAGRFVLAIDSSRSIKAADLEMVKKAARRLIDGSAASDSFTVVRFNDEVRINCPLTTAREKLARCVDGIRAHGSQTKLYAAVYDSIDLLGVEGVGPRAVVVFTDGKDEGSGLESGDLVALARENSVPVHVVAVKPGRESRRLERLARLTGGSYLRCCKERNIDSLYGVLKSGHTSRYDVRFRTTAPADGIARPVEVRLRYDSLRDRDSMEVSYPRGGIDLGLKNLPQSLMAALILAIVLLLLGCVILLLRRGTMAMRRAATEPAGFIPGTKTPYIVEDFEGALRRDEEARRRRDRLIGTGDPEYVYAKAWLVERDGPEAGKKFPMYWEEITIGRDEENAIIIKDDAVSLKHARIREMKGAYYLFDLASDNGTFLNGRKLLRPRPLYDWDEIRMGRTLFIFRGSKIS